MEFRVAVLFIALYYVRPQDWLPGMAGMNIINPLIAIWVATIVSRQQRVSATPLRVFQTPHDWVMVAYLLYVALTASNQIEAFLAFLPNVTFYFLTVLSLTGRERIISYLKWWNALIVIVALLGVMSLFSLDLTGAREMTLHNDGRLSLGTWMHNNPNALAHTTVIAIALSYVIYFWEASWFQRVLIFPFCAGVAFYCTYQTQSKGGFLVGAFVLLMVFVIGRPLLVRIIVLVLATAFGVSSLAFLPRMADIENVRNIPGVEGRLMAWHTARDVVRNQPTGEGYKEFEAWISWEGDSFPIATHSSYVEIGADLGIFGLFFFTAGIWVVFRTVLMIRKSESIELERIRRLIALLILSYCFSGWMINREYHTEYFLTVAVAAAVHRQILRERSMLKAKPDVHEGQLVLTGALNPDRPLWTRYGLADCGFTIILTAVTLWFWDYVYRNL